MNKDKSIIQRALPLDVKYELLEVSYIPVIDGGSSCDNCGKLISNIAHVKSSSGSHYHIGMDCLDTVILNNELLNSESYVKYLFSDKPAITKAKSLRAKILKAQKNDVSFKAIVYNSNKCFGFSFEQKRKFNTEFSEYEPMGFDYTFNKYYFDLTMAYIKDLPNIQYQS